MSRRHVAVVDGPSLDGTYSWFCPKAVQGECDQQHFGFKTLAEARAAADKATDHPLEGPDEYEGRFDGVPGLVWYAKATPTRGDQLKEGDCLDSLDHSGARSIYGVRVAKPGSGFREVCFSGGWEVYDDGSFDGEVVRDDVMYDVVDPGSQVQPDGSPL